MPLGQQAGHDVVLVVAGQAPGTDPVSFDVFCRSSRSSSVQSPWSTSEPVTQLCRQVFAAQFAPVSMILIVVVVRVSRAPGANPRLPAAGDHHPLDRVDPSCAARPARVRICLSWPRARRPRRRARCGCVPSPVISLGKALRVAGGRWPRCASPHQASTWGISSRSLWRTSGPAATARTAIRLTQALRRTPAPASASGYSMSLRTCRP